MSIGSPEKMEPITKVSHIPSSRWALVCSLCNEKFGASIQVIGLVPMPSSPFPALRGAGRGGLCELAEDLEMGLESRKQDHGLTAFTRLLGNDSSWYEPLWWWVVPCVPRTPALAITGQVGIRRSYEKVPVCLCFFSALSLASFHRQAPLGKNQS